MGNHEYKNINITVVGIGYVGLSIAVLLSQKYNVKALDIVESKVNQINKRISPIVDNDITEYLKTKELNLTATTDVQYALAGADCVIIATPTNYNPETTRFDTSSIEQVLNEAQEYCPEAIIVIKSTIPVGYTERIKKEYTLKIMFSPEFLREGRALYDNLNPSRIIVGSEEKETAERFANMLASCAEKKNIPMLIMGTTEAEAVKLFSNTFLATRISFFNELDTYAESNGLNSKDIIDGVCLDPRIGNDYNNPSFGYGGYCLPKDTKQLLANYKGIPENIIGATVEANTTRKEFIAKRIMETADHKSTIGVYRLTMKSNSDNFRESSIFDIMEILNNHGYKLVIYEPTINNSNVYKNYEVMNNLDEFKRISDLVIANRYSKDLEDIKEKVYTRDIYHMN